MPDFGQDLLPISGTLRRKRAEARLARAAYGTDGWRLIAPDDDPVNRGDDMTAVVLQPQ